MSLFNKIKQEAYWERRFETWEAIKDTTTIAELAQQFNEQYTIISQDKILEKIVSENQVITVVGSYFGDEGKGKITDALSRMDKVEAIARVNSGANAGHTVYHNGEKMVFHVLPSAVTSNKKCFVGPGTVVDPISLMQNEVQQLIEHNISYDNLAVGNFFITTPYHRIMDLLKSKHNSSTGVGIAPTHASKMWKSALRLDDLFNSSDYQREIIEKDLGHYSGFISEKDLNGELIEELLIELKKRSPRKVPEHVLEFSQAKDKTSYLINLYKKEVVDNEKFPKQVDVEHVLNNILAQGKTILVEGPQSYFLSNGVQQCHRYGTSANTHSSGILAETNINIFNYRPLTINVAKFPGSSRVGIGNIPASFTEQDRFSAERIDDFSNLEQACVDFDKIQKVYFENINGNGILKPVRYQDSTGEYLISEAMAIASSQHFGEKGATTNKPRIVGLYDCVMQQMVAKNQGPHLVISAMDRGDDCDYVGLTVGYVVHLPKNKDFLSDEKGQYVYSNGDKFYSGDMIRIGQPVPNNQVLKYCQSITKVMLGWKDTPISAKIFDPKKDELLPQNICNVINAIETYTGFNVLAIGNGVNSEDLIFIEKYSSKNNFKQINIPGCAS